MIKTVAYSREDECDQKMAINNVHVQLCMMTLTMFQEGNKLFQTGCWFNPKLPPLLIPFNGFAVSVIADWSLLLLIVFPDC